MSKPTSGNNLTAAGGKNASASSLAAAAAPPAAAVPKPPEGTAANKSFRPGKSGEKAADSSSNLSKPATGAGSSSSNLKGGSVHLTATNPNTTGNGNSSANSNKHAADAQSGFDIYKYLNEDKTELLRDPVLQQMTVVRYEGELEPVTGFFHGLGKMVSTLGYTYSGAFVRGLMHGVGRITWSDGTSYEGDFVDNTISGSGKYSWPNGDWYEGDVRLHVRHGKGKFYYKALDEIYEGDWEEGLRHGKGTLKYSEKCEYRGDWVRDRRTGRGVMKYADGGTYDGEWLEDIRHGQGLMKWTINGAVVEEYRGQWVHGTPSGQGTSIYVRPPQGLASATTLPPSSASDASLRDTALNTYTGEYLNGNRHGFGTFIYDDGSRYEGQWLNNLKHGEGKHTSSTGVVYVGVFADGNPTTPITDVKPETTVACPVPLYIRDVLAATEANESEAIIAVQSVVSRHHGQLRRVFQHYCSVENGVDVLTTPPDWKTTRAQGTLYMVQFLRMCSDCKLINQHLTICAIDRLLLAFKDRHESTTSSAYLASDATSPATDAAHQQPSPTQTSAASASLENSPNDRKPSNTGSQSKGKGKDTSMVIYNAPWERYRNELHQFTGELNFREFVEALVRVAAALYREPVYGSVANKLQLVLDEHLTPFACIPSSAAPLCKLCRENRSVVLKYTEALQHCFGHFSRASAMGGFAAVSNAGSASPATSPTPSSRRVTDVSMTVRQLALMLKQAGLLAMSNEDEANGGAKLVRLSELLKALPYDKHPVFTRNVYRKAFIQHALGSNAPVAQNARPNPVPTPNQPPTPSGHGERASLVPGSVSNPHLTSGMLSTVHSQSTSVHSMLDDAAAAAAMVEAEAAFNAKVALQAKSRGAGNKNFKSTVCMDVELTFVEFVEALIQVAVMRGTENTTAQRISSLMLNYILPLEKDLPPVAGIN